MFCTVESIRTARSLASILGCTFHIPLFKSRVFPVDQPEMLVAALLVVGAKLCFPFSANQQPLVSGTTDLNFNWEEWQSRNLDKGKEYVKLYSDSQFRDIKVEQVLSMNNEHLDDYLQYMSNLILDESKCKDFCSVSAADILRQQFLDPVLSHERGTEDQ